LERVEPEIEYIVEVTQQRTEGSKQSVIEQEGNALETRIIVVIRSFVRYTPRMESKRNNWQHYSTHRVINLSPKGIPFMPGLSLILLGAIIILAPRFFLAAVSMLFILMGALLCYVAWKFVCLKKQFARFAQDIQSSVEVRSFNVRSDDIDITEAETDTKKILYH
jgi:hypothetical protein